MGNLSLIQSVIQGFSTRWLLTDGVKPVAKTVVFESTTGFNRSWPGQTADHPVEEGSPLTDHHIKGSKTWSMTVLLTTDGLASLTGQFQAAIQKGVTERADQLEKWWEDGEILTLGGKDPAEVKNIMIESMNEPKNSTLGGGRMFELTLKQVRIADTDAVQVGGGVLRDQEEEIT